LKIISSLPIGTEVGCIDGTIKVKTQKSNIPTDQNYIDLDTRFDRIAYGLIER